MNLTVVIVSGLTASAAAVLFFATSVKKKALKRDIEELKGLLPNANCGGCGYRGCMVLAEKILTGEAPFDSCVSGGPRTAVKIVKRLNKEN